MKKLILGAAFIATLSLSAAAADKTTVRDDVKDVSYSVLNQFYSDFRQAENVIWTVTSTTQKAEFELDGVKQTAFYNLMGTYLGVTQKVGQRVLPANTKKQITDDYPDYKISEVIKFETGESPSGYGAYATEQPESLVYFVDLKKDDGEVLLKIAQSGDLVFFKKIK